MHSAHMQLARRRALLAARPLLARRSALAARPLCGAASSELHVALERHKIPPDAVPPSADAESVLRQLRFLEMLEVPDIARAVKRDPAVLTLSTQEVATKHLDYLLSLGITRVGPMIEASPSLLSCDLTRDLHRKVTILQALGVKKIGSWLFRNRGRIVAMDVDADLRPPVEFLQSVHQMEVNKVIEALPNGVFGAGVRDKMEKRVRYLSEEIGVGERRVGRMVSRWPFVLTMSLRGSIQPKVGLAPPAARPRRAGRSRPPPR